MDDRKQKQKEIFSKKREDRPLTNIIERKPRNARVDYKALAMGKKKK